MGQIGVVFLDLGITMNFSNVFWGCLAMEILIIFIHRLPARLLLTLETNKILTATSQTRILVLQTP